MKYSAFHKKIIHDVSENDMQRAVSHFVWAMKQARELAKVPIGKRKSKGPLEKIDSIEKAIIDGARIMGIEFGVEWGDQLDLTDFSN